jgi:hypothetical protein
LNHPICQEVSEIQIIVNSTPSPTEQFFLERFLPKNTTLKIVDSNKIYQLEKLIFPSLLTRLDSGYLPIEYLQYFLEEMTIQEQIDLFYAAEIVVAIHGAGLTNIIYSPTEIIVIELFPTSFVLPHYYYLAKSLNHKYYYLCSDRRKRDEDFKVNIEYLGMLLTSLLGQT